MNRIIRTVTAILLCGMLCCPVVEAQGRRPGRTEHNTVNNNHGGRPGGSSRPNRPGNGGSHNPGNNNPGRPNRPGNGGSHNPGRPERPLPNHRPNHPNRPNRPGHGHIAVSYTHLRAHET